MSVSQSVEGYPKGFYAYLLSASCPHFVWGFFWVASVFSIYETAPSVAPLWVGTVFLAGSATVLIAAVVIPLFHSHSALRVFKLTQLLELAIIPFYVAALWIGSLLGFAVLVLATGILDEVGKGVYPPILKAMNPSNMGKAVSLQSTWALLGRFFGTLTAGFVYFAFRAYSYLLLSAVLAVAVGSAVLVHTDAQVSEGKDTLDSIKHALVSFREGRTLTFVSPFVIDNLLDGIAVVLLTVLFVGILRLTSTAYGLVSAALYLASSAGAYLVGLKAFDKRRAVFVSFILTSAAVALYGILNNLLGVALVAGFVGLIGTLGSTVVSQVVYEDTPKGSIALVNQIVTFATWLPFVVGNFAGGIISQAIPANLGLLALAPFYAFNAFLARWILGRVRKVAEQR